MLDFDELQEFPNISSWATKSDFICDLMGTQNHKTLYDPWLQGSLCMGRLSGGNWTISTDVMETGAKHRKDGNEKQQVCQMDIYKKVSEYVQLIIARSVVLCRTHEISANTAGS